MTKEQAITQAKQFRKDADELLQRMKGHKVSLQYSNQGVCRLLTNEEAEELKKNPPHEKIDDLNEVIAQHTISIHDLESAIMRQGMALKYIGTPNPYPDSKDPSNTVVNPTADGLKL